MHAILHVKKLICAWFLKRVINSSVMPKQNILARKMVTYTVNKEALLFVVFVGYPYPQFYVPKTK